VPDIHVATPLSGSFLERNNNGIECGGFRCMFRSVFYPFHSRIRPVSTGRPKRSGKKPVIRVPCVEGIRPEAGPFWKEEILTAATLF
jgi:hypothetical protein